ncbi:MAG: tRNA lysidine(34) synthetase TilS [Lachnospiraceae bacterium]|nr:tRNA lysidine(34) synthetase TilS [Lachnospiraceae bacterium]
MVEKIYRYIKEKNMLRQSDTVLVGVSGGADSVCLLYVLCLLKKRLGIDIIAVHVHHGIRGSEADRDAQYVSRLCERLGVKLETVYYDIPAMARDEHLTEEEAGRIARYKCFNSFIDEGRASKIAVAHNKNDNAETIIFNLIRGSGVRGLSGIQPVRGSIIRPLLCTQRSEIEAFLKEQGLEYCTDSTNLSEEYTRNKIRKNILGYAVENINEGAIDNIALAGSRLSEAEQYLDSEAKRIFGEISDIKQGEIILDNARLCSLPSVMRKYVLMNAFERLCGRRKDITMKHIESTAQLVDNDTGHSLNLPYGMTAIRSYDRLILRDEAKKEGAASYTADKIKMRVFEREKDKIIPKNMYTKWFDYDKIINTVEVRTRKPGDTIAFSGGTKTIARYMIDEKIPSDLRDELLLLADGSDIIWVTGYRISEKYKVTDTTKTILEVSLVK